MQEISAKFLGIQGGFRGWAIEWCQANFSPSDSRCHSNEIWNIMG